jgi:CRP-like cAMP-binding protein
MDRTAHRYAKGQVVFGEGAASDAVYYVLEGCVKVSVLSALGKEAILMLSGPGEFVGETALAKARALHDTSATALTDCVLLRITMTEMTRLLRDDPDFSRLFVIFLLSRNSQFQNALVDQLSNQSEKRLARVLLVLAGNIRDLAPVNMVPKLTQQILADMVGTTRPRISLFLSRFKSMGWIEYIDGEMYIRSSLIDYVLSDPHAVNEQ